LIIFVVLDSIIPLSKPQTGSELSVRLVQANIGNFLKIRSEKGDTDSYESVSKKYDRLSSVDNGFKPDLIVWPETAYPETFYGSSTEIKDIFKNIMDATGAELLIGGYDQDPNANLMDFHETIFNSSILISEGKFKTAYHKNILIPFGETLPFGPF